MSQILEFLLGENHDSILGWIVLLVNVSLCLGIFGFILFVIFSSIFS